MKTKLKRAISFILALVTLIGAFPVSPALAVSDGMAPQSALYDKNGKVGDVSSDYDLQDGQILLTKTAEPTGVPNQYKITLSVKGKGAVSQTPGADIVLVLDQSGSMGSNGISALKAAATTFIKTVLADGKTNRVSIVNFASTADDATDWYGSAQRQQAINSLPTEASGGTNTQMGLYKARKALESSNAANKFIVLMSDGKPTLNSPTRWSVDSFAGKWKEGGFLSWYDYVYTATQDDYNSGSITFTYENSDEGDGNEVEYRDGQTYNRNYYGLTLNSAYAAIYEAGLFKKAADNKVYTIAYKTDSTTQGYLNSMSSGSGYQYSTSSNLEEVFKQIGDKINENVSGGVTDPMGGMINIGTPISVGNVDNIGDYHVTNGTVSFKDGTFTWAPELSETPSTLTYIVELDVEKEGFVENTQYPTNGPTTIQYQVGTSSETGQFNVPTVSGTYSQVFRIGYLVNENGEYLDESGNVTENKDNAVVVSEEEAVGNPNADGRNQWKSGRNVNVANPVEGLENYELKSKGTVEIANIDGVQDYIAEFKFCLKSQNVTIEKVDENGDPLTGAEFTVNGTPMTADKGKSKNSTDSFKVEIGKTYTVTESKVPAGHEGADEFTISIDTSKQVLVNDMPISGAVVQVNITP